MASNQPLPNGDLPHTASETASHQIASALRRSRLTLLCGDTGARTSALLIDGVMPQLRRRSEDAVVSVGKRPLPASRPVPDRRSPGHATLAELAILVSDWAAPSQARLHDGIDAALRAAGVDPEWHREPLTDRVQSLGTRFGTRFLFVLDGFEAVLEAPDSDDARADLLDELVRLLNTPVPANLLIAMPAAVEPLMAPVLDRLHAVRAEVLMLEGGRTRRVYGPAAAAPAPASPAPKATIKPPPTQLSQFDSARMPEAANTGTPTRPGPFQPARLEPRRPARPAPVLTAPSGPSTQSSAPPTPPPPRRVRTQRLAGMVALAIAALAGGTVLFRAALPGNGKPPVETAASTETLAAAPVARSTATVPTPTPAPAPLAAPAPATAPTPAPTQPTPAATQPAPTPATPPGPVAPPVPEAPAKPAIATFPGPSFALRVDADNAATRLPRELAQALAADGIAQLQIVATPLALPATSDRTTTPGLAIVRYDALQAAARTAAKPALAVVAPLYTEELQIVVRADSPLRFIHQIEGRRINVGAAQGARAVTGRALYRQMFDQPLPAAQQGGLEAAPALQQLLAGDGLDVVVLVGPQPAAALAALPPAQRRGVRLLALAPSHAASRRALQAYLPANLRDAAGATTPSLAAMSFLVTTGRPDAQAASTLAQLTTSLCRSLPGLQRDGDAKWRDLRAGLQLDTGWPQAGAAEAAWRACAGNAGSSNASPPVAQSRATATATPTANPTPSPTRN